jgi:uncharacterized protein (DUF433 family)
MKLLSNVIHSDPDIMGGIPVFVRTRVPIRTLLDYLEAGDSLDIFLDHFPSVSCEQAIALLHRKNDVTKSRKNYRFIHRLLQEHFAKMQVEQK